MIHVPEHLIKFSHSNQTMVESLPKDQESMDLSPMLGGGGGVCNCQTVPTE